MRQLVQKNKTPETLVDELGGGGCKIYSCNILFFVVVFFQCELIAPSIVKELAKGLDPLKTCETLKLCTNGTRGTSLVTKYSSFDSL